MSNLPAQKQPTAVDRLKMVIASPSVQEQFANALRDNSSLFVASLIDLYASDTYLQKCEPRLVVLEALKAATLKLPINKSLGFAYVVPYKKQGVPVPQFQIGYRGLIQLAMRSGIYRCINADVVLEGELKKIDKLSGLIDLDGVAISDLVVGYFAYLETTNGFRKTLYKSRDDIENHAKRYSKAWEQEKSPWHSNFNEMAVKTTLRMLLGKYGLLSVEMASAMDESDDMRDDVWDVPLVDDDPVVDINAEIKASKHQKVDIDVKPEPVQPPKKEAKPKPEPEPKKDQLPEQPAPEPEPPLDEPSPKPEPQSLPVDTSAIPPQIVKELNEIDGKDTVDALDTWAYRHHKRVEKLHGEAWTKFIMEHVEKRRADLSKGNGEVPMIACPEAGGRPVAKSDCELSECSKMCPAFNVGKA